MDLFQIINKIKKRPGMYLGSNSITALSHFLNGYQTAYHDLEIYWNGWLFPLDFKYMSEFTNIRLKYDNTMGWFNNILNFCDGDEKTALYKFFDLYDEFRQVHMKRYWKAILTENNIQYNNSMEHTYMLTENGKKPIYTNPSAVYVIETDIPAFILAVETEEYIKIEQQLFKKQKDAKGYGKFPEGASIYFGEINCWEEFINDNIYFNKNIKLF